MQGDGGALWREILDSMTMSKRVMAAGRRGGQAGGLRLPLEAASSAAPAIFEFVPSTRKLG